MGLKRRRRLNSEGGAQCIANLVDAAGMQVAVEIDSVCLLQTINDTRSVRRLTFDAQRGEWVVAKDYQDVWLLLQRFIYCVLQHEAAGRQRAPIIVILT